MEIQMRNLKKSILWSNSTHLISVQLLSMSPILKKLCIYKEEELTDV